MMLREEAAPSRGWTVLAVDNNDTNLQFISQCLQANKCRVLTARNGKSALEKARRQRPHLVFLEVTMPGMDGFETCWHLKAAKTLQKIPIVFMAETAGLDEKVKAFELGAADFVTKPIHAEEVVACVQTHLHLPEQIAILEEKVRQQSRYLADANQAFKAILDQREMEKRSIEQTMVDNLKRYVFPYLEKLDRLNIDGDANVYLSIIRTNIDQLIAPVSKRLSGAYLDLTPTEIKVADLVRQNKRTKFIAESLRSSPSTVEKHRNKIRKKLNILNKKVNLTTYLNSLS